MRGIWLNHEFYIPVDELGYVEGPCFEGMLGCVMQLRSGKGDVHLALKIPRLLADTIEENAYICRLTEDEMHAVRKINARGGHVEGLVPGELIQENLLVKRRSTENSDYADARAQNHHVVFVSFERDKKPRFCAVNFTPDGPVVFPEGCQSDFVNDVRFEDWSYFGELMGREPHRAFSKTIFRGRETQEQAQRGLLIDALRGRQFRIWYAAVPSIVFRWAKGNLQETITKQQFGKWSPSQHFILFEQILRGLRFLHGQGMIHGDVRPANIMWLGSPEPGNYYLGDYGSYGKEWQAVSKRQTPGGLTLVGPAIGQRRQTAFYSPERRAGNEFESADTAIITTLRTDHQKEIYYYVVLLGWRSALLDNGIKPEVAKKMTAWATQVVSAQPSPSTTDDLQSGDRLRIRNYLFEVIKSEHVGKNQRLFLCSGRYADILHDTLVVYKTSGSIKDGTIVDLSNYIEYHQWAAASDLYSFGAVCLYSLFCHGLQNQNPKDNDLASRENPDRLFLEMMEILESVPYFRFFWEELENFRRKIEELYHSNPQPSPEAASGELVSKDQSLYDMALHATNNILQSTFKARVLLEAFDFNLAHFLLFVHFVLACLHRRSHLSPEAAKKARDSEFFAPFAEDRIEPPAENGAASRALDRLQKIKQFLEHPFFRDFKCKDVDDILDFDPRSCFQIRMNASKIRAEIAKLKNLRSWKLMSLHPEIKQLVDNNEEDLT